MSFFDDYVADGFCCQSCGGFIGDEPGYPQFCHGCAAPQKPKHKSRRTAQKRNRRAIPQEKTP